MSCQFVNYGKTTKTSWFSYFGVTCFLLKNNAIVYNSSSYENIAYAIIQPDLSWGMMIENNNSITTYLPINTIFSMSEWNEYNYSLMYSCF